jgi:hypothetical protein
MKTQYSGQREGLHAGGAPATPRAGPLAPSVLDTYKQSAQVSTGAASSPIPDLKNTRYYAMSVVPWNEGFEAGRVGIQTCPYPVGTSAGWAWSSGYIEGAANAKSTR